MSNAFHASNGQANTSNISAHHFQNSSEVLPLKQKAAWTVILSLIFLVGYKGTQLLSFYTVAPISLNLPGEDFIPFIPESFFIYLAVYLIFPLAFMLMTNREAFMRLALVFLLASVIHYCFFIFMPVHFTFRPHLSEANQSLINLVRILYVLDSTTNCFPSMHVSFSFLSYFGIKKFRPQFANGFLAMAIAISLSTLLLKQHYLMDIMGALLLVLIVKPLLNKDWTIPGPQWKNLW